jgi:hypothetical protein
MRESFRERVQVSAQSDDGRVVTIPIEETERRLGAWTDRKVWPFGAAMVTAVTLIASATLSGGCTAPEQPVKVFEDVTQASGLGNYVGITHGAAWGDFDGDGLPDVYVTNHLNDAQLFRNLGHGSFADVSREFFAPGDLGGDKHGAAWADFDNDGRLDLVQLTGAVQGLGQEPKRLFRNRGTRFEDVAAALGVANPYGRARMPLWIDLDHDGRLDLFEGAEARFDDRTPPFMFLQRGGRFAETSDAVRLASRSVPFCIVTELGSMAFPDLVCRVVGRTVTVQVFDTSVVPTKELDLLPATAFEDVAAGDFDNDGAIDLFLARKNVAGAVAFGRRNANEIVVDVSVDGAGATKPAGFTFRSKGKLAFRVASVYSGEAVAPERIHIGKEGVHPEGLAFSLAPESPGVTGTKPHQPGAQAGIYVGLTAPDKWEVFVSGISPAGSGSNVRPLQIAFKIVSSEAISDLAGIGDSSRVEEAPQRLFINRGGKLVEEGDKRGVNKRAIAAVNVVAGDFNNDMHLDLFVLGSGEVGMQENLLLLNRGGGRFEAVPAAGGATPPRTGVGDSVTTVDFDRDGCLDLFIATGGSMGRGLGLPSEAGGYRLYRNLCDNGNHWLEIDLEGTVSNRDAIGSRVRVTAGGVTQTRIQDGGIHERGQNHSRLHFGLGRNVRAEKILVQWPNGRTQELSGVGADQVIRIKEGGL